MKVKRKPGYLVINADDFGYSASVNQAIVDSFAQGFCSSTTIMPNMPAFEQACQLCHERHLEKHTGMHLVLCEGTPLTDDIKRCSRLCNNDGMFKGNFRSLLFKMDFQEREALAKEIHAQIERCRNFGIPLTHIDSHKHIHVEWAVMRILMKVAKARGVRYLRLAHACDMNSTWIKNLYRQTVNIVLKLRGFAYTSDFGIVEDYMRLSSIKYGPIKSFEIMTHPDYNTERLLVDRTSGSLMVEYVGQIPKHTHLVPYGVVINSQGCK